MYKRAILVCSILMALSACTRDKAPSGIACQSCSVSTISFARDIIPIFKLNCALSGCHVGPRGQGGVILDSAVAYASATQQGTGYINAGNPNTSILYTQLLPVTVTSHMPVGGQLGACDIQKIFCWINQGALNN